MIEKYMPLIGNLSIFDAFITKLPIQILN